MWASLLTFRSGTCPAEYWLSFDVPFGLGGPSHGTSKLSQSVTSHATKGSVSVLQAAAVFRSSWWLWMQGVL